MSAQKTITLSAPSVQSASARGRIGRRPRSASLGLAFAGLGLGLSTLAVRETTHHVAFEAANHASPTSTVGTGRVFLETSFRNRSLSSISQAGLVNNLNDGMAWGLLPIVYASAGLSVSRIGLLAAAYPAVWGPGQLVTGPLSDRIGRKHLITGGMWTQAAAIGVIAATTGFGWWLGAAVLLGVGTAMVYPTLLAAIGDVAHPSWRASAVGVYRLWRDAGFAVGALLTGIVADLAGAPSAIWTVSALTFASGVVIAVRMEETLRGPGR
ncbi:MAG: MFS transporter [Acidimicrobiia bacterium]